MLLQMALFCSFLWLSSIPLHACNTSLSFQLWWDGYLHCFHVLATVNSAARNTGALQFNLDIRPGVGLLDHMVVLFLVFWGTSVLFSIVVAPTYIPTNSVGGFPSLRNLSSICCLWIFLMIAIPTSVRWYVIVVLICISPKKTYIWQRAHEKMLNITSY